MITLYHITDKSNIGYILSQGLVPQIGNNSRLLHEHNPCIYLTDEKSIPYWLILLGIQNPVVLRVQLKSCPRLVQYSNYKEYRARKAIPPRQISVCNIETSIDTQEAMKVLCQDYVYNLSRTCVTLIQFYEHQIDTISTQRLLTQLMIAERFDFTCYSQAQWRAYLKNLGENGEYTFLDLYAIGSNNPPLWAKLLTYPQDQLTGIRTQIAQFIQSHFYGCLDLSTGGWTG